MVYTKTVSPKNDLRMQGTTHCQRGHKLYPKTEPTGCRVCLHRRLTYAKQPKGRGFNLQEQKRQLSRKFRGSRVVIQG